MNPLQHSAGNPNTSKHTLESIWAEYPHEVLRNPVLPLLLLEDPSWFVPSACRRLLAVRTYQRSRPEACHTFILLLADNEQSGFGDGDGAGYGLCDGDGGGGGYLIGFDDGSGHFGDQRVVHHYKDGSGVGRYTDQSIR